MRARSKKGLLIIFFLFLLIAIALLIGAELFQIHKITVLGNDKIVYNDIIRKSGLVDGQNIFKVDKQLVKERLESNPYIDVQAIKVMYPDHVIIEIKEREKAAVIEFINKWIYIDHEGVIVSIEDSLDKINCPIIKDLSVKSFMLGTKLNLDDSTRTNALVKLISSIYRNNLNNKISEVSIQDINDIRLVLTNGLCVKLGHASDLDHKLSWLKSKEVMDKCQAEGSGILDITVSKQAILEK